MNGEKVNNRWYGTSKHFSTVTKSGNVWKGELATHSKYKNTADLHTGINKFKKDEKGDLLADTHNVLFEWVEELGKCMWVISTRS
jgi:hypothetical protein